LAVAGIGLALVIWRVPRKYQPVLWAFIVVGSIWSMAFAAQYRLDLLPKNDRLVAAEVIHDKLHLRDAVTRAKLGRQAAGMVRQGQGEQAVQAIDKTIQRYGEDRTLLKTLAQAYAATGDSAQAQLANDRLQQFLAKRLF
jgi:predicted Zn-dependent protease